MGELRVKGQGSRVKGLERQNISISVFLISILLLFFAGCSGESKKNYRLPAADQVLENFSTFRSERGKKVWELVSTRAKIYEKQNIVEVMDFKVDFYSKDGSKVKAQLSAPRGRIDT
ncbi:MAG: LPS export ABC transporter periplasmic protein LptC, partial [Elusimicrobiota bacterium]